MTCVGCPRIATEDDAWTVLVLVAEGARPVELGLCPTCQRTTRWSAADYVSAAEAYLRERMRALVAEAYTLSPCEKATIETAAKEVRPRFYRERFGEER